MDKLCSTKRDLRLNSIWGWLRNPARARNIKTVEAYLSGRNVFVSAPTGAGKSSTFELARIFRTTVSFVSAQFRHKMLVKSEPSPLDVSFPAIKFKQALVNFRFKSFFVITLVQSKQICSFDRRRRNTHVRLFWSIGVEPILSAIQSRTSKCYLRHQLQVTPLLVFGAKRKWKAFKRDKSTSRDFVARSAA